jgi:FkbM family methyltransferase
MEGTIRRLRNRLAHGALTTWLWRRNIPLLNLPIPCRMPSGGWILSYGDMMGYYFLLHCYLRKSYEGGSWRFVRRYLKEGMTFLDVGANQGFYTILASKLVGASGKVIAFEPVPSVLEKLRKNVSFNRLQNVSIMPLGLSIIEESRNMNICINGMEVLSSLKPPAEDVGTGTVNLQVDVVSLDGFVSGRSLDRIDFVKIDVEGGELEVLEGGQETWIKLRPVIMCEVEDRRTAQWNYRARSIYDFMVHHGYAWFDTGREGSLRSAAPREEYEGGTNLIGIPVEKVDTVGRVSL